MTAVNRGSKDNAKLLLERGAKIDCDSLKGMHLIATAMGFHDIGMYHRRFFLYFRAN
jgi:hypothetical protein